MTVWLHRHLIMFTPMFVTLPVDTAAPCLKAKRKHMCLYLLAYNNNPSPCGPHCSLADRSCGVWCTVSLCTGVLVYWCAGVLVYWCTGVLYCRGSIG